VIIGTGIGGAVINDGKLSYGAHLYAGEFGSAILNAEGQSFNYLVSPVRMAERYCEKLGLPKKTYSGKEIFERAEQGDADAQAAVENFYQYLSIALFNLQVAIDPEIIIIGGGLSANTTIIENVEQRLNELLLKQNIKDFTAKLVPCHFRNSANLVGAVKNFINTNSCLK